MAVTRHSRYFPYYVSAHNTEGPSRLKAEGLLSLDKKLLGDKCETLRALDERGVGTESYLYHLRLPLLFFFFGIFPAPPTRCQRYSSRGHSISFLFPNKIIFSADSGPFS